MTDIQLFCGRIASRYGDSRWTDAFAVRTSLTRSDWMEIFTASVQWAARIDSCRGYHTIDRWYDLGVSFSWRLGKLEIPEFTGRLLLLFESSQCHNTAPKQQCLNVRYRSTSRNFLPRMRNFFGPQEIQVWLTILGMQWLFLLSLFLWYNCRKKYYACQFISPMFQNWPLFPIINHWTYRLQRH